MMRSENTSMPLTRQETADELIATKLDRQSLEAILQAVKSVSATGWGEIKFNFQKCQIVNWEVKLTEIVNRKQE